MPTNALKILPNKVTKNYKITKKEQKTNEKNNKKIRVYLLLNDVIVVYHVKEFVDISTLC